MSNPLVLSNPPLRTLPAIVFALALSLLATLPASAQEVDCPPPGQEMLTVPEITRDPASRTLPGVITISDQERLLWFKPTTKNAPLYCAKQRIRYVEGHSPIHADEQWPKSQSVAEPLPAPTLRARVGDVVMLNVLNQIDTSWFGLSYDSLDQGKGCDTVKGETGELYPGTTPGTPRDKMPNCFHGSSTTNLHFHGTHTNPNSTGDNVFLNIRPSLRKKDGTPKITEQTFREEFNRFFEVCAARLQRDPSTPSAWPYDWQEIPQRYWKIQQRDLTYYDENAQYQGKNQGLPPKNRLWPKNQSLMDSGEWPHYYTGAFPYCFELPEYQPATWPPSDPNKLQMGQAPGTHWYHAHKHGSTHMNVSNAMTGVLVVEGDYDDALKAFYAEQGHELEDDVLVIQQLGMQPNMLRAAPGQVVGGDELSVNARRQPVLTMRPGEVRLWRIVNAAARSGVYFRSPSTGLEWRQTAQDGVQLAPDNYARLPENVSFLLAAGNRADLLVRAPLTPTPEDKPIPVQATVTVTRAQGGNDTIFPLFSVRVAGDPVTLGKSFPDKSEFPEMPVFLADIEEPPAAPNQELVFDSTGDPFKPGAQKKFVDHTIDGKKFNGHRVDQTMQLGKTEEWKIVNWTGKYTKLLGSKDDPSQQVLPIAHPFHIHINPFQVVEIFDPTDPIYQSINKDDPCYVDPDDESTWKPCEAAKLQPPYVWWDVFPMPVAGRPRGASQTSKGVPGYFKMRSRFVDYTGQFVLHCHILAHEDRGMMQFVQVVDDKMKGPHH